MHRLNLFRSVLLLLFLAAVVASAEEKARVALRGYDPVAYFTDNRAVKGDPKYSYDWDEGRYYFANERHREMFVADPDRFAPQFNGYCTGSMSRGVRNEGHPEAWVIVDGRLYLFGAPDSKEAARQKAIAEGDVAAFRVKAAKAAANWREGR